MSAQYCNTSSDNVFTRIKSSLVQLNDIFSHLLSGESPQDRSAGPRSPLPSLITSNSVDVSGSPCRTIKSINNRDRVMQLLEDLKEDFGLVYSQGGRHDRKSAKLLQKLRPLHIKGKTRFRRRNQHSRGPSLDGSEGEEEVSLERIGTSWVWSAPQQAFEWDCSIAGYKEIAKNGDAHIVFEIKTVMSSTLYDRCQQLSSQYQSPTLTRSIEDERRVTVFHRFNDFKTLFGILVAAYPYLFIPPLPPNRVAKLRDELSLYRRRHLELWLRYFAIHPILSRVKCIHEFLLQDGNQWAPQVNAQKSPEKSISKWVKSPAYHSDLPEKFDCMDKIETSSRQLEEAIGGIRELSSTEQVLFSKDLPTTYAHYCVRLQKIRSLLNDSSEGSSVQSWDEIFFKAAQVFNERASSLNSKTEHFDEINAILEEFFNMVKQLRKFAATNMITKVEKRDSETTLKALSAEAEFHWVLKNQVGRLALELADFCESHAKLLEGDAVLCRRAVDIFRTMPSPNI
uniref:Phox n=1 Tax=Echinococcus granulosus TaxID=6210 RepID=A0A068WCZ6_ECHGR|nr:Phox [Echinococcus granulosus]